MPSSYIAPTLTTEGVVDPQASEHTLDSAVLRAALRRVAVLAPNEREALSGMAWALRLNNLKIASSTAVTEIVHRALQIIGINGYRNDTSYSVGRQYRDALSASLMVSNDRILAKGAQMLLVLKDE